MTPATVALPAQAVAAQGQSLLRSMGSSVVANCVYSACQWGVLIAIAHLGSRAMLGQYALALAITTPVFALMSLNGRSVQASDAAREYSFRTYLSLRLLTTVLALAIVFVSVTRWNLVQAELWLVFVVALAKAVDAVADCFYGRLQQVEAFRDVAAGLITNGIVTLAAGTALLAWTGSLVWLAAGSLLASSVALTVAARAAARLEKAGRADREPARDISRRIAALSRLMLPLGVVAGLGALVTNLPHYFVRHHLGAQELGLYAAMASLASVADLIGAAALQAVLPRLAREHHRDRAGFLRLARRLSCACALAGLLLLGAAALYGDVVLRMAYGASYQERTDVFLLLTGAVAVALIGSPLSAAATAARRLSDQMGVALAGLIAGVCAGVVLVPRFGLPGAAATMLVITTTRLIGQLVVFRRCVSLGPVRLNVLGAVARVSG